MRRRSGVQTQSMSFSVFLLSNSAIQFVSYILNYHSFPCVGMLETAKKMRSKKNFIIEYFQFATNTSISSHLLISFCGSWVCERTGNQWVASSSLGQTHFNIFNIQTAPSSLFTISLVFTYFCSEKALEKLRKLSESINSNQNRS